MLACEVCSELLAEFGLDWACVWVSAPTVPKNNARAQRSCATLAAINEPTVINRLATTTDRIP